MSFNTLHIRKYPSNQNYHDKRLKSKPIMTSSEISASNPDSSGDHFSTSFYKKDKRSRSKSKSSNHDYRLRYDQKDNFPNGYLEDWSSTFSLDSSSSPKIPSSLNDSRLSNTSLKGHNNSSLSLDSELYSDLSTKVPVDDNLSVNEKSQSEEITPLKYNPVSIILSTQSNILNR